MYVNKLIITNFLEIFLFTLFDIYKSNGEFN